MNFYSSRQFCQALQSAYFPEDKIEQRLFQKDGKRWILPTLDNGKPVINYAVPACFIDFYEPLATELGPEEQDIPTATTELSYAPRVSHGLVTADEWERQSLDKLYQPAPTVFWETVESWDAFAQMQKKIFSDSRRRFRKLEAQLGPLTLTFDDCRPEILSQAMALKSQQYRASGEADAFAHPGHRALFESLAEQKSLLVSSLMAGEKLLAAHVGAWSEERLCYWLPAYDSEYRNYGTGRILLLFLLEESFKRGNREFDFLRGHEPYKWLYATHTRLIGELGSPGLSVQVMRQLKSGLKPLLLDLFNAFPPAKTLAKTVAARVGV
jgi:hypothetical protein